MTYIISLTASVIYISTSKLNLCMLLTKVSKNLKLLIVTPYTDVERKGKGKSKVHPRTGHEGPEGM